MRLFLDHFTISLQIVALTPSYKFSLSPSNISKQGLEFGSDMSFLVSQDFGSLGRIEFYSLLHVTLALPFTSGTPSLSVTKIARIPSCLQNQNGGVWV